MEMKNMRLNLKQIFIIIFAAVLTFMLTACGAGDDENIGGSEQENVQNAGGGGYLEEPEIVERMTVGFEPVDFGGYEFMFLTRTINDPDWAEWNHRDLTAEEITGEVINDAVFNRNRVIEEQFNITINETVLDHGVMGTRIRQAVNAGDELFDAIGMHLMTFSGLAQEGMFVNLFDVPYLDLTKPWWDQGTVRDLSIMNKLFVTQGDLLVIDNDAMEAMIFNKRLLRDHNLESPFEIVRRGEWTFRKLIEMSRGVARDLNGDGIMFIQDDLFGGITQADTSISFLVSGGERIAGKDASDIPIITFGSERSFRIMDYVSEIMLDDQNFVQLHRYAGQFGIYDEQVRMMEEDRALFSWIRMIIVERLRGMETDFGLLPLPKLDEAQPNYITHMNPHTGVGIAIPITATDIARTGMILEALSAESRYTLRPAYYEISLRGRYVRDDESEEMLDIILSNTAHDIGYVFNFGGFAMDIVHFGTNRRTEYASAFERALVRMERDIERMIERFENLD